MANLTDWSPDVLPHIMGLPEVALKEGVRNACREFCKETLLWTYELSRIDIVANTRTYDLTIPTAQNAELISAENVKYKQNGADDDQFRTLDPISETQEDLHSSGSWRFTTAPTPNGYWVDPVNKQIHFYQIPTEASSQGLLVLVNLKPNNTTNTVPDFLYSDHKEAIAAGALADLLNRKAMPWYDPVEANRQALEFLRRYSNARWIKTTGLTRRPSRVRMRDWL